MSQAAADCTANENLLVVNENLYGSNPALLRID